MPWGATWPSIWGPPWPSIRSSPVSAVPKRSTSQARPGHPGRPHTLDPRGRCTPGDPSRPAPALQGESRAEGCDSGSPRVPPSPRAPSSRDAAPKTPGPPPKLTGCRDDRASAWWASRPNSSRSEARGGKCMAKALENRLGFRLRVRGGPGLEHAAGGSAERAIGSQLPTSARPGPGSAPRGGVEGGSFVMGVVTRRGVACPEGVRRVGRGAGEKTEVRQGRGTHSVGAGLIREGAWPSGRWRARLRS